MSENNENASVHLEKGTYEIIKDRLSKQGEDLRGRLTSLNAERKKVFGSIETQLIATERITTENNCLSKDMVPIGNNCFIFGYNVHLGLKSQTAISDVFSVYHYDTSDHQFHAEAADFFEDERFLVDFNNLYKFYRETQFAKFAVIGQNLFMVFQVGKTTSDIKTFKWAINENGIQYIDNRSDHEFAYPEQHEFVWQRATRDMHRQGLHPHVSILDKVFVETVGGDLTIKVEDNTQSGKGVYAEPVEEADQTLDDAEIYFAEIGNLIVLKIKPYQEEAFRYIVYNNKIKEALRIDVLEDSCVFLPDNHGIIFAQGYYLQTGEFKLFDNQLKDMSFEKRIPSPNGEDQLYVFYQKTSGLYILLSYNLIEQEVKTPVICNGYSFFDDGELIFFKAEDEQKKHHAIQIWQTPYYSPNKTIETENKSYLFKLGNKEIVKAMAECGELLKLINKDDNYDNLYIDLVKLTADISDTYHWLNKAEAFKLNEPLTKIKEAASSAIDEFEKVVRLKRNTQEKSNEVFDEAQESIRKVKNARAKTIDEFVERLGSLRQARGQVLTLKDLRYADTERIDEKEAELHAIAEDVSQQCVQYLLKKEALDFYVQKVDKINKSIEKLKKVVEADRIGEDTLKVSSELELLIETVSNLKIEDATESTRIINNISSIYSQFNRINANLKRKRKELLGQEGEAEFNSKLKLVNQGITNYLDISNTPEKCDEYLNKLMVQLEELEGKFIEFDSFLEKITEKREEVYNAFESKKAQLIEAMNNKASSLQQSGERIIKSVKNRLLTFKSVEDINAYMASDLMVEKVRDLEKQLIGLGDTVKADDLNSKLKSSFEEAVRQLKDKQELFVNGENSIQLGKHIFNVNSQKLDLTLVYKDQKMFYHLTGTEFFEEIEDEAFLETQDVWEQRLVSENDDVYRGEYLAHEIYRTYISTNEGKTEKQLSEILQLTDKALVGLVQQNMNQRYDEGYSKGVHDKDAASILKSLVQLHLNAGLLRYGSKTRVLASLFWEFGFNEEHKQNLNQRIDGLRSIVKVFPENSSFQKTILELNEIINSFEVHRLEQANQWQDAGKYLLLQQLTNTKAPYAFEARHLREEFVTHLKKNRSEKAFEDSLKPFADSPLEKFDMICRWMESFVENSGLDHYAEYLEEAALVLLHKSKFTGQESTAPLSDKLTGLLGEHNNLEKGNYELHLHEFLEKLRNFDKAVAHFRQFTALKKHLVEDKKEELRLEQFRPRVLSSFVRNQLIDEVYLPLIGDNLAKQIGTAGDSKRTDLMGMLLLISPPGYGKTTLMEYMSNRLGLIFMKINGPALGHSITSIDPSTATNSAAREELEKLNLAFEMGDNVMIYLDDIQHCHPEFLQKFISLCDAQRKIEGVYKGRNKTYDLRGKKVAVVMAGNPYTESGDKFQVPDMLVNRADVYNLGDIIGGKDDAFEMSYLENSITSNAVISSLNNQSRKDIYQFIQIAATNQQEGLDFDANYNPDEIKDYVSIFRKMIEVRKVILAVNKQYILSAGQANEYRKEPAFKLQGSYRDMNKIVEKLSTVMNDEELQNLLMSHYQSESQTLTSDTEYNLLKLKSMFDLLNATEKARKLEIEEAFQRNQKFSSAGGNEMSFIIENMEVIAKSLRRIGIAIEQK